MPITILTFDEWSNEQNPEEIKHFGSTGKELSCEMIENSIKFKDLEDSTKKMFYRLYVYESCK